MQFKKGDSLRLTYRPRTPLDGEGTAPAVYMTPGQVYTVERVRESVMGMNERVYFKNIYLSFSPQHFELARKSNEERIKEREAAHAESI
jgi:IS5 family transposase